MKRVILTFAMVTVVGLASTANASIISVTQTQGNSNLGSAATTILAPKHLLDDTTTNSGMQGFDEAQGVVTSVAHSIDGGGTIAAGTSVNSHMIFLNTLNNTLGFHGGVVWTFSDMILGVMSNKSGTFESLSSFELGAAGTNYTTTFAGSGAAAPFRARGIESNNRTGLGTRDGYQIVANNELRVSMRVSEPGDWIRVVTASPTNPVTTPEPGTILLLGSGLVGLGFWRLRKGPAA